MTFPIKFFTPLDIFAPLLTSGMNMKRGSGGKGVTVSVVISCSNEEYTFNLSSARRL